MQVMRVFSASITYSVSLRESLLCTCTYSNRPTSVNFVSFVVCERRAMAATLASTLQLRDLWQTPSTTSGRWFGRRNRRQLSWSRNSPNKIGYRLVFVKVKGKGSRFV